MNSLIALSPSAHANKKFLPRDRYHFAKEKLFAPILLAELSHLIPHYLLGFLQDGDRFLAVALLGTADKNLYVNHDGMWLGGYVPSAFRGYPFAIAKDSQSEQNVFCLHEEAFSDAKEALPLFDDAGQIASGVKAQLDFLQQCEINKTQTQKAVDTLQAMELLTPWELVLQNGEGKSITVNGLYRVDEAALNALDGEKLVEVRNSAGLALAYGQLFSMLQSTQLTQRAEYHAKQAPAQTKPVDLDALFGDAQEDILKF